MPRHSLALVALFAISFTGFFGYSYLTRPDSAAAVTSPAAVITAAASPHVATGTDQSLSIANTDAGVSQAIPAETVDRWIVEATDNDPNVRAAAISALASAPRLQAIPVLQRVVSSGEPAVDRPLALRSLRTLALQQGDADSGIRNVLRQAIYHGDDEAVTLQAQAALSEVEGGL